MKTNKELYLKLPYPEYKPNKETTYDTDLGVMGYFLNMGNGSFETFRGILPKWFMLKVTLPTSKELKDLALEIIPYEDNAGSLEDDIDASKRNLLVMGAGMLIQEIMTPKDIKPLFEIEENPDLAHSEFKPIIVGDAIVGVKFNAWLKESPETKPERTIYGKSIEDIKNKVQEIFNV